jgi:hypothetical protein
MDGVKTQRSFYIDTTSLVTLVDNVYRGAEHPDVGYEDAHIPFNKYLETLKSMHAITVDRLESGLWSCNLLNEEGKFWHPRGLTFDQFLGSLKTGDFVFNKTYNVFESRREV